MRRFTVAILLCLFCCIPDSRASETGDSALAGIDRSLEELVELMRQSLAQRDADALVRFLEVEQAAAQALTDRLQVIDARRDELEQTRESLTSTALSGSDMQRFAAANLRKVEEQLERLDARAEPDRRALDERKRSIAEIRAKLAERLIDEETPPGAGD